MLYIPIMLHIVAIISYFATICNNITMNMGDKLKTLRLEEGLTQTQLAKNLQIGRSALSMYELGIRQIPHDLILIIAKYFDVSLNYLYGLED